MLAPKGLKVGDVFVEDGVKKEVTEVIPFIGYNTKVITRDSVKKDKITDVIEEIKDEIPDYEEMTIKELQALCKEKGLSIRGTKYEVIERLRSN